MKKALMLIVAAVLTLACAACGPSRTNDSGLPKPTLSAMTELKSWSDIELSVFGLSGVAAPPNAKVVKYRYTFNEQNRIISIGLNPVEFGEFETFMSTLYNAAKSVSEDGKVTELGGDEIQHYREASSGDRMIYQFRYSYNGETYQIDACYFQDDAVMYDQHAKTLHFEIANLSSLP